MPLTSSSGTPGPQTQSGSRIARPATTSRPAPTVRASPHFSGGAAGSSEVMKARPAR